MSEETTHPITTSHDEDGNLWGQTHLSPTDHQARAQMCVRPTTVVPVIFVPGIMGANLCNATTKESVWNTNSIVSLAFQWIFRSSSTRQTRLDPENTDVDDGGRWYGSSATVSDAKTGLKRGEGTTSRAFYGDFVRWLDDELNSEHKHAASSGDAGTSSVTYHSPWQTFVDGELKDETWHAQKTFEKLEKKEADKAWGKFFCPVYAQGYNWLKSNGEAGKYLADKIKQIIQQWNTTDCGYHCEQVILVSHSMGGLATRAAVHPDFGNAASQVLGIVHGEQPANGAAAAYHHCRNGYGGVSGWILGRNAAQVTAVFANAPGAMELLPNHQYNDKSPSSGSGVPQATQGPDERKWLKARLTSDLTSALQLPSSDPYVEIYSVKDRWWRLIDPALIDPSGLCKEQHIDPWNGAYQNNLKSTASFHYRLAKYYHSETFIHYGADFDKYPAYGDLVWKSREQLRIDRANLLDAVSVKGSNPVTVKSSSNGQEDVFSIMDPDDVGYPQPGDETVPTNSGEAPFVQGGNNIKQSFRLAGFKHQAAYDNTDVRHCTLYAIGKLLQSAKVL